MTHQIVKRIQSCQPWLYYLQWLLSAFRTKAKFSVKFKVCANLASPSPTQGSHQTTPSSSRVHMPLAFQSLLMLLEAFCFCVWLRAPSSFQCTWASTAFAQQASFWSTAIWVLIFALPGTNTVKRWCFPSSAGFPTRCMCRRHSVPHAITRESETSGFSQDSYSTGKELRLNSRAF